MTVAGQEEIPKTQRAAVSDDASGFEIREIPVVQPDELEPGRALVKVLYSGVCHVSIQRSWGSTLRRARPAGRRPLSSRQLSACLSFPHPQLCTSALSRRGSLHHNFCDEQALTSRLTFTLSRTSGPSSPTAPALLATRVLVSSLPSTTPSPSSRSATVSVSSGSPTRATSATTASAATSPSAPTPSALVSTLTAPSCSSECLFPYDPRSRILRVGVADLCRAR